MTRPAAVAGAFPSAWLSVGTHRLTRRTLASALSISAIEFPGLARGKEKHHRKHKHKEKKRGTFNEFGCVDVGSFCKTNEQCCSGICAGKKGKQLGAPPTATSQSPMSALSRWIGSSPTPGCRFGGPASTLVEVIAACDHACGGPDAWSGGSTSYTEGALTAACDADSHGVRLRRPI